MTLRPGRSIMTRFAPHPGVSLLSYRPGRTCRPPHPDGSSLAGGASVARQTSGPVLAILPLHPEVSLDTNLPSLTQQTFYPHGARTACGSALSPGPG